MNTRNTTEQVYEFIINYYNQYEYMPSIREITDGVHLKSTSSVELHIQKLLKQGKLETDHPGCARAYRLKRKESL